MKIWGFHPLELGDVPLNFQATPVRRKHFQRESIGFQDSKRLALLSVVAAHPGGVVMCGTQSRCGAQSQQCYLVFHFSFFFFKFYIQLYLFHGFSMICVCCIGCASGRASSHQQSLSGRCDRFGGDGSWRWSMPCLELGCRVKLQKSGELKTYPLVN